MNLFIEKVISVRIIKPYLYIYRDEMDRKKLMTIERSARLCYKSEKNMGDTVSKEFLTRLISSGHESAIEHEKITVYFAVDRGVSHEIVRHRIGSYSQESTRYCNYSSDKFGKEITVIEPFFFLECPVKYEIWKNGCLSCESAYLELLNDSSPQEARSILPNSLKTEICVTYNMREWRHFFKLRCTSKAHPQMQQVSIPLLLLFKNKFDPLFYDLDYNYEFPEKHYAEITILDK